MLATQEILRENENLKQRVNHLEKELGLANYERGKLDKAFEDMKRKIEERVPAIAEVEKRRIDLENEILEKNTEMKNIQDQLRDTIRKNAKL